MVEQKRIRVGVIGGGAGGFFAAIRAGELGADVRLFEATQRPLSKVLVSGGGRCNVTHACFDPAELARFYPRGSKELRSAFARFQPADTVRWFEARGVELVTEDDGRIFPKSNRAESIAATLRKSAADAGVEVCLGARIQSCRRTPEGRFEVCLGDSAPTGQAFDRIILATGSSREGHLMAEGLGHAMVPPVPSLFTFVVKDPRITGLQGLVMPSTRATLHVGATRTSSEGPVLVTHWGLSGPAILRLSAFAARDLAAAGYRGSLSVEYDPSTLPRRLRQGLGSRGHAVFEVSGRGVFKSEFVTAGGVSREDIDFRTYESRRVPGFYVIGEAVDVDGVTGGFNFQNAWTGGYLAGTAAAEGNGKDRGEFSSPADTHLCQSRIAVSPA